MSLAKHQVVLTFDLCTHKSIFMHACSDYVYAAFVIN